MHEKVTPTGEAAPPRAYNKTSNGEAHRHRLAKRSAEIVYVSRHIASGDHVPKLHGRLENAVR
jgi:hypothetical protein